MEPFRIKASDAVDEYNIRLGRAADQYKHIALAIHESVQAELDDVKKHTFTVSQAIEEYAEAERDASNAAHALYFALKARADEAEKLIYKHREAAESARRWAETEIAVRNRELFG